MNNLPDLLPAPHPENLADLIVHSRVEILALLRALRDGRLLVTAYYGGNDKFILTDVLEVDPKSQNLAFSLARDAVASRGLLEAKSLVIVAVLNQIKIQFNTLAPSPCTVGGNAGFVVPFPASVLRIQRRDAFRVAIPFTRAFQCSITSPQEGSARALLRIVELSITGLSAYLEPAKLAVEAGVVLDDARLEIPGVDPIVTRLEVRHALAAPRDKLRLGCRYVGLPGPASALLQRYINELQRQNLVRK